jgi:hypothetical protein
MIPTGLVSVSTTTITGTYKDLADFHFAVDAPTPFAERRVLTPSSSMSGRLSSAALGTRPTGRPRDTRIVGTVISSSAANRLSDVRNLVGWCARAVALQTHLDANTFLQVDELTEASSEDLPPTAGRYPARVTLSFMSLDPLWYATSQSAVTFTTDTAMALGTAPVAPVIRITGTLADPTITLKDHSGATVTTLGLTITQAGASDYVEIDCGAQTIVRSVSSVLSDAISTLSSGYFFELDPADADTVTPTWPSLSIAYGSGSGTAVSTYRKAYF